MSQVLRRILQGESWDCKAQQVVSGFSEAKNFEPLYRKAPAQLGGVPGCHYSLAEKGMLFGDNVASPRSCLA
jgi:hypothetical protein